MTYQKVATIKIDIEGGTVSWRVAETEGTPEHILGFLMTQGRDFEHFLKTNSGEIVVTLGTKKVPATT